MSAIVLKVQFIHISLISSAIHVTIFLNASSLLFQILLMCIFVSDYLRISKLQLFIVHNRRLVCVCIWKFATILHETAVMKETKRVVGVRQKPKIFIHHTATNSMKTGRAHRVSRYPLMSFWPSEYPDASSPSYLTELFTILRKPFNVSDGNGFVPVCQIDFVATNSL